MATPPLSSHADGVRVLLLLIGLAVVVPAIARACPTCSAPAMPGLAAPDQWGAYPLAFQRSGPRLQLEGAADRMSRLKSVGLDEEADTDPVSDPLQLYVAGDLLAPATITAGFTWRAAPGVGLHVCGPEVTFSVNLP